MHHPSLPVVTGLAQINKQVTEKWKSENEVTVWLKAAAQ